MSQDRLNRYDPLRFLILFIALVAGLNLAACSIESAPEAGRLPQEIPGGDPRAGVQAIQDYGCDACHTIPGILGADTTVGPPLTDWADRRYIAGKLPNNPANLIRWIQYPQAVEPGTVMPNMDVTEQDARDISAYLYTLGRDDTAAFSLSKFLFGE